MVGVGLESVGLGQILAVFLMSPVLRLDFGGSSSDHFLVLFDSFHQVSTGSCFCPWRG